MDISKLPDNILLKIFQYLPFEEQARIERVNERFRFISQVAISQTKSLNFETPLLKGISPESLFKLIDLCAANLQRVEHISNFHLHTIAQFTCPRLIELKMNPSFKLAPPLVSVCDDFFRNNRQLQILDWSVGVDLIFPNDIVFQQLHTLKLRSCTDVALSSLVRRCPNLKHFSTQYAYGLSHRVLDEFFATTPNLETLVFDDYLINNYPRLTNFWRLERIRVLRFRVYLMFTCRPYRLAVDEEQGTEIVVKISKSFPRLEILDAPMLSYTSRGSAALAKLKNLRLVK